MKMGKTPEGKRKLHDMLRQIDPESAGRVHENDVRRVSRAIEIYKLTGMTLSEHSRLDMQREGDFREIIFAPDWPREALYRRIDARVDEMLKQGLVEEVHTLMASEQRHPTALQAIGYKEIAAALRGEITMEHAVWLTKKASRNLAKRQLTWFRRDPRVIWLEAEAESAETLAAQMQRVIVDRFGNTAI
jgi:tRNA dimethylallyltransferase